MKLHRITPRIAFASALLGVITGIALGALNLFFEYEERQSVALANTDRFLHVTLPIVESAYWEVDVTRVQVILSGLLEDPLIYSAWIEDPILTENQRDTAGLSNLRATRETVEAVPSWAEWAGFQIELPQTIKLVMTSPRDGSPLGDLVVQLSFAPVMNEFAGRVLVVLGLSMLQTLFVTTAIFFLVQVMIIRPITQLQQATVDLREERGFQLPPSAEAMFDRSRQDEISRLARAFQRTFNALEDSRRSLQKNVDDRTAELQLARNEAIAASETKSQFLANMNHELRTPLNAISGLAAVMDKQKLPQKARPLLTDIKTAAAQLSANIDSVLDLSKIEAGEMDILPDWFKLSELTDAVAAQTRALLIDKAPKLVTRFEFAPGLEIYADQTRLRQIVMNFASNAVKFTETGSIGLTVHFAPNSQSETAVLSFSVSDTGQGIPKDKFEDVFRPFGQIDGSTSRAHEGTGLGMSIAQHLASALGGEISIESEVGVGSEFTFSLDVKWRMSQPTNAKSETPAKEQEEASSKLVDANILIVEDNRMNRSVFVALLEQSGAKLQTASDGFEAMERISQNLPDALLMDLHMPLSDGFETLATMQRTLGLALPPAVATSADATTTQKKNCKDAGFFEFVPKPVDADDLLQVMTNAVEAGALINRNEGLRYAGGDVSLFNNALKRFREQLPEWQRELNGANTSRVADILHIIKGAAGTVGAKAIASAAKSVEQGEAELATLLKHLDRLESYLSSFPEPKLRQLNAEAIDHLHELISERNPSASDYISGFDGPQDIMAQLKQNLSDLRFGKAEENLARLRQSL